MKRLSVLALLAVLSCFPALADWTATGTFQYIDREFDQTGFTGVETPLPIRLADVEVIDPDAKGKGSLLATGVTNVDGTFSIFVSDNRTRNVYVRVVTRSDGTPDLNLDVRDGTSGKPQQYAVATATVSGHSPGASVDFGTAIAGIGQGGEPFNLYDQMVSGVDYMVLLTGFRPSQHLSTVWGFNNGVGSSNYDRSSGLLIMRDSAGYDDTVLLHEMAHFVVQHYSSTDSPGGAHTFSECDQDVRLSFEEGFATYWGNSVLRHAGLPHSNIYTRTNGGPGAGNLVRYSDLETDTQYLCEGSSSEVNVAALMWDISDGASTPDTTPGVDDAHDLLDLGDLEVWQVMTDAIPQASFRTLEDFWDGWFLPPLSKGFKTEMIDLAAELAVEYFPDAWEINDDATQAAPALTDGTLSHGSLFADPDGDGAGGPDADWFSYSASSGQLYVVETANLFSGADTVLRIYDTDGQTLLASNDDRASGDNSSLVSWTAPRSDLFYAQVTASFGIADYGSYDLSISAQSPVDNDGDTFDTTTDCNDSDPAINPGATEICDGVDQNCDGVADDGFDLDADFYTTCGGDCDDADPNVNPAMDEVPANGIDDNCNGVIDEVPQTDTVTITRATYKSGPNKLTVEATSDQQPGVTLTVVGLGTMSFDSSIGRYTYTSPRGTPNPGTVTVESSGGGSDTAAVN